ncbi:MAG: hypothetical protein H6Q70_73 [Firmicutes bacterium]|nr:hypothetical protein [Bacillota bacterium]
MENIDVKSQLFGIERELLGADTVQKAVEILKKWKDKLQENGQKMPDKMNVDFEKTIEKLNGVMSVDEQWNIVFDVADRFGSLSRALIKNDILQHVEESVGKADPEIKTEIQQMAVEMFNQMNDMENAEKKYGTSPEVWENISRENIPAIKESLSILKKSIEHSVKSVIDKGREKVFAAFKKSADYLRAEQEKVCYRDAGLKKDIKEIKEILISIDSQLKNKGMVQEGSLMSKLIDSRELLEDKITQMAEDREKETQKSPFRAAKIYQKVKAKVLDVKQSVVEFPRKIEQAARNKLTEIIAAQTEKIAEKFERVIQYIGNKKDYIVAKSETIQANISKTEPVHEQISQQSIKSKPRIKKKQHKTKKQRPVTYAR